MKKLILSFSLIITSFTLLAQTPLEWQKISLEEKLNNKVKTSLSKILEDNQYVVESEVSVMDPGLPNFDDMNKVGLKVSDIPFSSSKGDYIAFSKIGLEVPVIEKYMNDNQQKLKELYRFNESYNIFKNIEKVDIRVWISDQVSPELFTKAENVVRNLKFPVGDIQPQLKFEKISIEEIKIAEELPKDNGLTLKDILSFISDFGNAIGLVLATLLFGYIAYRLLKLWEEIMLRLKPQEEVKSENEDKKDDLLPEHQQDLPQANAMEEVMDSIDFERFKIFLDKNPTNAIQLIKKWLRTQDAESKLALKAVAQQLDDEALMKVFAGLDMEMRTSWKYILDHFLSPEDIISANKFISEEVVRSIIEPDLVSDPELVDILLSLNDESAKSFILEHKDHGKTLMNLLTPDFSGKILDSLDPKKAASLIQESLNFDFKFIKDSFLSFKNALKAHLSGSERKPFGDKILQMLPDFNPLKEKMLYEFLAKNNMRKDIQRMACEHLPSELIIKLPQAAIKKILTAYDKLERAMLLLSLEEEQRDIFINSFAEEGSALREMLDFDFEEVQNNPSLMNKVEKHSEDIWKGFVSFTRHKLHNSNEFNAEIEELVFEWVEELVQHYSPEQKIAA